MHKRAIVLAHRLVFDGGSITPAAVALVRRTLKSLAQVGVRHVCIVDGEQADLLRDRLALHEFPNLDVEVRFNRSWRRESGSAVLVGRDFLCASDQPCLVMRGDRPLDQEALAALAGLELGDGDHAAVVVATPPHSAIDMSGEAKIRLRNSSAGAEIAAFGLDLERHDAIFTGHALVTSAIVPFLEELPNPSLADGLAAMAESGRVAALTGRISWPWGMQPVEVDDKVDALLATKQAPRYTLLNPGPVNTTAHVKSALVHHDVSHRDSGFSELLVSLTGKLRRIFRASPQHSVVMITGSGTAAMECAVSSTVPRDRKILIVDNGAFGERLYEIARLHEMDIVHLRYAWGDRVNPADVRRAFDEYPDIAVVAMVHHETSVGLLNPVREVGAISRENEALFVVDAVSSLGAEDLDVVRDNIDVCYSSANKCLHAISGAGFICVAPRVWQAIETIKPRSYYLNLKRYRRYIDDLAQTPFTPAVSNYFALDAACAEFLADGHAQRLAMYRRRNLRLRRGLADLGMYPFTRTGHESHSVVTCCVPSGVSFSELYEGLKNLGYIVYGCKDVLADKFLQVANMGDLDEPVIDKFLASTQGVIQSIRAQHELAAGAVEAPPARVARA
jgi:2-aminoethylphosphonate-pyruvate transaminase